MTNSNMLVVHKLPILFSILNEIKSILKFGLISINDNKIAEYYNLNNIVIRLFNVYGPGDLPGKFRSVVPNFFFFEFLHFRIILFCW